ncbi:hypothetical protein HF086_008140 [Spodoptera exigua]|uniref:Uncharacterized protein n=1 Tax=Spodoptera exigua TaxID=7107 RepID=A0A922MMK4_SPOEX|nr:hypothetical protein HF086_008140 [Spodoptera exigua]
MGPLRARIPYETRVAICVGKTRHMTCLGHLPKHKIDILNPKKQIQGIIRVACAVGSPFAQDYEADDQSLSDGQRPRPAPRTRAGQLGP